MRDPSPTSKSDIPSSQESMSSAQVDGLIDCSSSSETPGRRRRRGGDVCAIFVHAGAGYHSIQNERVHLSACEDAAKSAMAFLNNGATAVEAVEIAIKILEDKEITNAGFGSNLAIDGTVECDATIVDHYGRSGAVGAVGCLRNPIHLARLILDHSTKPLSLRRVPPNLLVGPGATSYAEELGVKVVHPDTLVSPAAGERYKKWKTDLHKIETPMESETDNQDLTTSRSKSPDDHPDSTESNLELVPCWNESQPYSPQLTPADNIGASTYHASESNADHRAEPPFWSHSEAGNDGSVSMHNRDAPSGKFETKDDTGHSSYEPESASKTQKSRKRPFEEIPSVHRHANSPATPPPTRTDSPLDNVGTGLDSQAVISKISKPDDITDTVGAIAIDCFGNLAAGSSSGGIGMKHRGRVGPAALVGIGTAVVPVEPGDETKLSVATVTSGTGEHMATTMAAGTCANRLYSSCRKARDGTFEYVDDDDQVVHSFVETEFMGHPSVQHSHSAGAIGILGVKKTTKGVYFYFAHNTDSFAIGSMTGDEKEPRSVMSRNKSQGSVVTGGRSIKHRRWPANHRDTWPNSPEDEMKYDPQSPPSNKRQKVKRTPKGRAGKVSPTETPTHKPSKTAQKKGSSRSSGPNGSTSNSVC